MSNYEMITDLYGAIATPDLVGRDKIISTIQQYLEMEITGTQFIFLTGEGGIGKTRLLGNTLLMYQEKSSSFYTAQRFVDLYDIPNHTPEELVEAIRRESDLPRHSFPRYEKEYEKLERMRLVGEVRGKISDQIRIVQDTFIEDLNALSQNKRVILALDTAERLVYFPQQEEKSVLAASWTWLVKHAAKLGNVSIVIAGRNPAKYLIQTLTKVQNIHVHEIEVGAFTEKESLAYFEAVLATCNKAREVNVARKIERLSENHRLIAHILSGGRPIMLALLVDFLTQASIFDLPSGMQKPIHEIRALTGDELAAAQNAFEGQLISYLVQNKRYGDALRAIGRAPKGIDARLLANLLESNPQKPDIERAEVLLRELHHLSFVKVRTGERYFFHDEVYALFERHVYNSPEDAEAREFAINAIREDYKERYKESRDALNQLYFPVEIEGSTTYLDLDRISEVYNRRRTMLVEMVYYRLHSDPKAGFKYYYRYMREALSARDFSLLIMIQAELSSYLGEPGSQIKMRRAGMDEAFFTNELQLFTLKMAWLDRDYDQVIHEGERLLKKNILLEPMATSAKVWIALARTNRGQKDDTVQAASALNQVIDDLPKEISSLSGREKEMTVLEWYLRAVLASAYRTRAYFYWSQGKLQDAILDYQQAAPLWRYVNSNVELAGTLNDLGFAMSEQGDTAEASQVIEDALNLRREVGPRMPVSLSLNTLGIIRMREEAYNEAIQLSTRALAIARALNDGRTACLALTAISEARRRSTFNDPLLRPDTRINQLREARDTAREAFYLSEEIGERLRQIEALIEWGCACRDWVRVRVDTPNPRDNVDQLILESSEKLVEAARRSGEEFLYRKVDALVDLAWLWFYAKRYDTLLGAMEDAFNAIPYEFHLKPGLGRPSIPKENLLVQLWTQLGKLEILSGHQIIDQHLASHPESNDINDKTLCSATTHYALGLEYNLLYSKTHPGLKQAKGQIYERFKKLKPDQLFLITQQVKTFEKDYQVTESAMQVFLKQRALWYEV